MAIFVADLRIVRSTFAQSIVPSCGLGFVPCSGRLALISRAIFLKIEPPKGKTPSSSNYTRFERFLRGGLGERFFVGIFGDAFSKFLVGRMFQ
jgi:hypothetical protein